jgi:hypothetical protein
MALNLHFHYHAGPQYPYNVKNHLGEAKSSFNTHHEYRAAISDAERRRQNTKPPSEVVAVTKPVIVSTLVSHAYIPIAIM